jgi:hypothetical protein
MIKFSKKEKETIHRLHLLTGKSFGDIKDFYEGLLLNFVISYLDKEPIDIPLFGEIFFHYLGDEVTNKGRKAKIDIDFTPNDFLLRVIGQIEDGEESDLEKSLKEKIKKSLEKHLENNE